jgi:indolepyruvate ferredoxin oxidoreductase, beta subunit
MARWSWRRLDRKHWSEFAMQQIAISGVGGQGILFITGVLAETALELDYGVFISETHGMAQRGGNVISHLKVGARAPLARHPEKRSAHADHIDQGLISDTRFYSPLIRPGQADILLALHPDGLASHSFYLKPGGLTFANLAERLTLSQASVDATRIATELGAPVCANLVLLGFAVGSGRLFCTVEDVEHVLQRLGGSRADINLKAFRAGREQASHRNPVAKR